MIASKQSKRQVARLKKDAAASLFILFEWEDDGTHSVMSADKVNSGDRLQKGDSVNVKLPEGNFKGTVITLGSKSEVLKFQEEWEMSSDSCEVPIEKAIPIKKGVPIEKEGKSGKERKAGGTPKKRKKIVQEGNSLKKKKEDTEAQVARKESSADKKKKEKAKSDSSQAASNELLNLASSTKQVQAQAEIMQCTDPQSAEVADCMSQLRDDSSVGDEDMFMNYQLSQFYGSQFPGPSASPSVHSFRQPEPYHRHSFSRSPTPSTASMFSHPSSYSEDFFTSGRVENMLSMTLSQLRADFSAFRSEMRGEIQNLHSKLEDVKKHRRAKEKSTPPQRPESAQSGRGCWFGVKEDDRRGVFIGDVEASALAAADAEGDPGKLGQALLDILFDDVTLAHGCVTKPRKEGIKQLDQARVHAIRVHLAYRRPVEGGLYGEKETSRWKVIRKDKLNVRCRQHRQALVSRDPEEDC